MYIYVLAASLMRLFLSAILVLLFVGCKDNDSRYASTESRIFYIRNKIAGHHNKKFYKDFDIFSRQGINEIATDTLFTPFFGVSNLNDTLLSLTLFDTTLVTKMKIPKGDLVIYTYRDINDGPNYIFAKIENNEIIRYGYDEDPYHSNKNIKPESIEIVSGDSVFTFFESCWEKISKNILPFSLQVDRTCQDCLIHYHTPDPQDHKVYHFYRDNDSSEYTSRQNPGDGLWYFQKRLKYWRDFHDMERLQ